MKIRCFLKTILLCASVGLLVPSCSQDEQENLGNNINEKKSINNKIEITTKSLEWDESYDPYAEVTPSLAKSAGSIKHATHEFVAMSNCFIGGVFTGASILDLSFKDIQGTYKPIRVAYTFPGYFTDVIDPLEGPVDMYMSLSRAVDSPKFKGKQQLSFAYDFKQMTHYSELYLAFGAKVDIASIFSLGADFSREVEKTKSSLLAKITQKNFSMLTNYPKGGNPFLEQDSYDNAIKENAVYVNSVTFGRSAIISIEGEVKYEQIKAAFTASLNLKKVGASVNLEKKHKDVFEACQIKIYIVGGEGEAATEAITGFDAFKDFIISGGEFTKDVPGVPISFTANKVSDRSVFKNEFVIKH